jgi:ankyrin repeat protein
LHYAATGPEPKLVALLLERGAQVDAPSPNGSTALMMAARYGRRLGLLLLAKGASTSVRNQKRHERGGFARSVGRDAGGQTGAASHDDAVSRPRTACQMSSDTGFGGRLTTRNPWARP